MQEIIYNNYFFVDESGDTTFYNRKGEWIVGNENGASKILLMGFIRTTDSTQKILPQTPSGEVCLQIVDYCNWAVQRAFLQNDMRYYKFLKEKFGLIVDLYDYKKGWKNFYSKKNRFDIKKISPLRLGIKKYSQHEADFRT